MQYTGMKVRKHVFTFKASTPVRERKSIEDKINEGHFYIGPPKDWEKHIREK